MIQDFNHQNKIEKVYSRTLTFVQSSGMGKSRLADTFGETCPMINYVLRPEKATGFPPSDSEILSFMLMSPPDQHRDILADSASKKKDRNEEYPKRRASVAWNHSVAVGLLQASFKNCKFCPRIC